MNRWYFNSNESFKTYTELIEESNLTNNEKLLFKSVWLSYLKYLDKMAIKDSIFFHTLQLTVIFTGLLIPVLEQSQLNLELGMSSITVISILGLVIAFATALNRHFKFEERWKHYRAAAENIRGEAENFFALTGNYHNKENQSKAFKLFIENISNIKRKENTTFITKVRKKSNF